MELSKELQAIEPLTQKSPLDKELAQRVPRRIEITNGRITRDDYLMILPQRIAVPEMEKSLVFSYALRPTDLKSSFLSKPSLQRNHP